ncbi:hypothetical protein ACKFKG_18495 [Phormidesmis sp. 146-35]
MTPLPQGFDYQGIYCYPNPTEASSFYYIPGAPVSQRTSQGLPSISLMAIDQFAMLQVSSEWTVAPEQLEAISNTIASQCHPSDIQLQLAPIVVESVTLLLKNERGEFEILGTTQSSGYVPFSAVFSVQLVNEQKAQAIAAFNGRADQLKVTYKATLEVEVSAKVTIAGDITADLKKLPKNPEITDCQTQIESAIAHHRLKVEQSASPHASDDLQKRTLKLAQDRAADLLLHLAQGAPIVHDRSTFRASADLIESLPVSLERSGDISTWFATGSGMDYVQLIG